MSEEKPKPQLQSDHCIFLFENMAKAPPVSVLQNPQLLVLTMCSYSSVFHKVKSTLPVLLHQDNFYKQVYVTEKTQSTFSCVWVEGAQLVPFIFACYSIL